MSASSLPPPTQVPQDHHGERVDTIFNIFMQQACLVCPPSFLPFLGVRCLDLSPAHGCSRGPAYRSAEHKPRACVVSHRCAVLIGLAAERVGRDKMAWDWHDRDLLEWSKKTLPEFILISMQDPDDKEVVLARTPWEAFEVSVVEVEIDGELCGRTRWGSTSCETCNERVCLSLPLRTFGLRLFIVCSMLSLVPGVGSLRAWMRWCRWLSVWGSSCPALWFGHDFEKPSSTLVKLARRQNAEHRHVLGAIPAGKTEEDKPAPRSFPHCFLWQAHARQVHP